MFEILCYFLTFFYATVMFYYLKGWLRLREWVYESTSFHTKVSVIIPARNEENNIESCIGDILAQQYPEKLFEVIVVDDSSEDKTATIVQNIPSPRLHLLKLSELVKGEKLNSYKKKAIEIGIQHAKGDLVITTDADCRRRKDWLATIVSFYEREKPKMIAAPVIFHHEKNSFEKFQTLDLMGMVAIGAAAIAHGAPVMCNGANLAYEKKAFEEVDGFRNIAHLASGDDVLLLHKIAARYPAQVAFLKSKKAIVFTQAEKNLPAFFEQRIRWASKSSGYKNTAITFMLAMVFLFNLSILLNLILWLLRGSFYFQLLLLQLFVKMFFDFLLLWQAAKFFERKKLFWLFLPSQFLHILYIVITGIAGNFGAYRWKGRTVR